VAGEIIYDQQTQPITIGQPIPMVGGQKTTENTALDQRGNLQTADLVGEVTRVGVGPDEPYYDPSAWANVTERRYGNTGRNAFRGPTFINLDASLIKRFKITESQSVQFRAEAYNVFNHAQYTPGSIDSVDPVTTTGVGSVNTINAGTLNLFNQPGQIFSSHPRVIQLALRLDF